MADISIPVGGTKKLTISFTDAAGNPTTIGIPTDAPVWTQPDASVATLDEATDIISAVGAFGTSSALSLTIGALSWSGTVDIGAGPAEKVVVTAE